MARYIDADFVTASINRVLEEKKTEKESAAYFAFEQFKFLLGQTPTADVVKVVRCKGCVHFKTDTDYCKEHKKGYCEWDNTIKSRNHFCSYGENALKERERE